MPRASRSGSRTARGSSRRPAKQKQKKQGKQTRKQVAGRVNVEGCDEAIEVHAPILVSWDDEGCWIRFAVPDRCSEYQKGLLRRVIKNLQPGTLVVMLAQKHIEEREEAVEEAARAVVLVLLHLTMFLFRRIQRR